MRKRRKVRTVFQNLRQDLQAAFSLPLSIASGSREININHTKPRDVVRKKYGFKIKEGLLKEYKNIGKDSQHCCYCLK